MKTFSTERGNHLFMSRYNITPAKEEEKKIICASHALYKKRPELELVEGGGGGGQIISICQQLPSTLHLTWRGCISA